MLFNYSHTFELLTTNTNADPPLKAGAALSVPKFSTVWVPSCATVASHTDARVRDNSQTRCAVRSTFRNSQKRSLCWFGISDGVYTVAFIIHQQSKLGDLRLNTSQVHIDSPGALLLALLVPAEAAERRAVPCSASTRQVRLGMAGIGLVLLMLTTCSKSTNVEVCCWLVSNSKDFQISEFPSDEEIATLGSNRLNQGKIQLLIYCISSIYYIARVSSQRCTTAYPCPVADLPGAFRDLLLHFSGWLFFPDAFCWYWDALTLH